MLWPEALDLLEARLAEQEEAQRSGVPFPPAFIGPSTLGPIPAELRQRATSLLERCQALEAGLAGRQYGIGERLAALLAATPAPRLRPPGARYVDTSA